jgi:glutamine kinase
MKAVVLAAARSRLTSAEVPRLVHFSLRDWRDRRETLVRRIQASFGDVLAVRSSARDEDTECASRAGRYPTVLGVMNEPGVLARAIDQVAARLAGDLENHVLVQDMVTDVVASGVVVTRDVATGAPYYVVEFDASGRTDTITSGLVQPTTAVVFRGARTRDVRSLRLRRLLRMTREVERWWKGAPLDIEFAMARHERVALLQVRPLAAVAHRPAADTHRVAAALEGIVDTVRALQRPHPSVAGARTILAQMADWNPAELIGAHPSPLAASLFCELVTDTVWQRARSTMGYRPVPRVPLMHVVAGRPYVDVRASFNSFLPARTAAPAAIALVEAWLARLETHPELHDRVELEVAQTAVDFSFSRDFRSRLGRPLRGRDLEEWAEALRGITAHAVGVAPAGSLTRAVARTRRLLRPTRDVRTDPLAQAFRLLAVCKRDGTMPFAIVARHAFIAEALIRSAAERGAWTRDRLDLFRRSLTTVAGRVVRDLHAVFAGRMHRATFLRRYGHLRPSSFDLASPRYDQRSELLCAPPAGGVTPVPEPFVLTACERRAFAALARAERLPFDADALLQYATAAITARELVKFRFTRVLSAALEGLAAWGARYDLPRTDVAYLTLADLREDPRLRTQPQRFHALVEARRGAAEADRAVRLGPLIRTATDVYVLPVVPALPSCVTRRTISAPPVVLDGRTPAATLAGRIVCIESADPGFDWIFAHPIAGLVTRFGGGNSHMAIRCAETDVPAALGVGEHPFERVRRASLVELRCDERLVRAL